MKYDITKIHPELQQSAKFMPKITFSRKNIGLINFGLTLMRGIKAPEGISIENVLIPTRDGQGKIRLRVYKPQTVSPPTPALVWIHGGGYITGKPEMDDFACCEYVRELGIAVVSVDYRLAPKHPFPAALEDCYSALMWAKSQLPGVDVNRIAIGGNSAGGGLAATLAQLAHDRQEVRPVFQLLVYPMLDDKTVLRNDVTPDYQIGWNQASNKFGWESYLGQECGKENTPDYSVSARRADLSGLPPAWIGVGTLDLFHDEDVAYARRLRESGVECELYVIPGAFHGFDVVDPRLPVIREFRKSQTLALKRYLFQ